MQAENCQLCPVCQDVLSGGAEEHSLPCNHSFHTGCIVSWFRSGQSRCPVCMRTGDEIAGDVDDEDISDSDLDDESRMVYLRGLLRCPDPPPGLRELVKDHKKAMERVRGVRAQVRNLREQKGCFRDLIKQQDSLRKKLQRALNNAELKRSAILRIPMVPLIIPVHRHVR